MSEMVDRVAAAIDAARWYEGCGSRRLAQVALEAMREPTEAMVKAAADTEFLPYCTPFAVKWRAMVRAALAE